MDAAPTLPARSVTLILLPTRVFLRASMRALAACSCALAPWTAALAQTSAARVPTWNDFPVIVWRQDRGEHVLDPRFARAFGAANLGRSEDAGPLAALGLAFYVDNAAGRDELHLDRDAAYQQRWNEWYATRADALLVRRPCLSDPTVRERMRANLRRTLETHPASLSLGISLGDEVSWTPYGSPEDTCLCEHCQAAWRAFLARAKERGATHLASDFALARASTDAARAGLEHGSAEAIHAWLLRREFTQSLVQDLLAALSSLAASARPEVPRGLLGMIGRSAFGGVAIARVLPNLGFAEAYRVSDARELLFTLRAPGQRVVQTIFFDERNPATPTWFAWESWLRGVDGFVIWSDRVLRAHPDYADALTRATSRIRALREQEPRFEPRPRGVAVVSDEASVAYGWLVDAGLDGPTWPKRLQGWQEEHGSRERSLRAWLRLFEDCAAMPGSLPLERVGADSVREFPLLVSNHLRVLDARGAARLEEFLAAGGTLAVRGELGAIDALGERPDVPWLQRLREKHGAKIVELGPELDDYLAERIEGGAALRERIAALLARARVHVAPWGVSSERRMPWLSTWTTLSDGSVLGATMPNLAEAAERDALAGPDAKEPRLAALAARITPQPGFALEWLNPREAVGATCRLPAGEAAVFRLVKR
ncbi:MAG TPA: hypothetical protein VM509_14815 [Planctomycetota bacterium]|nr:hypothetical protein [Planctomycetota bacterium]